MPLWVIDADDMVVGTPEFADVTADVYSLRYGADFSHWRRQLFQDGMPWRYEGAVHEHPACDGDSSRLTPVRSMFGVRVISEVP